MTNYTIEPTQPADINTIVDIHMESFPTFFLTFLGPQFLRLLYAEILRSPGQVSLVARDETGLVIGFVTGVTQQASLYKRLAKQKWLQFGFASLSAVLKKPTIVLRLLRAFRYASASKQAAADALLMSIAVAPGYQQHGVGKQLVQSFLAKMNDLEVPSVSLTTDKENNDRVNAFYRSLQFELAQSYRTPEGRLMNEYVIHIKNLER